MAAATINRIFTLRNFILALLFFSMVPVMFYFPGHMGDVLCWQIWSRHIFLYGLPNAYDSGTDYLPLYQYVLYLYGKIAGSEENIYGMVQHLRWLTLIFDWLGLWFIYKWIDRKISFVILALVSTMNIAYMYNNVVWGQVDGIEATLLFMALYYGYKHKAIWSSVFFLLALNLKLQAVIFLPVWGYFFLQQAIEQKTVKSVLLPLLVMVLIQVVILLPFINHLPQVWSVIQGSFGKYPVVGMNAFNIWYYLLPGVPLDGTFDNGIFFAGLTYNHVGLLMFLFFSFFALLPLLRSLYGQILGHRDYIIVTKEQVWLICSLIAIIFFFFNTQMHERYSHPAFIFITAYAFYRKRFFPYILFSIAYFLNMERVLKAFKINNYDTVLFNQLFVAGLFAILLVYLFVRLYKESKTVQRHNKEAL